MEEVVIRLNETWNREAFRKKVDKFKRFQEKQSKRGKSIWSEETRRNLSERIKKFWVEKKR